MTFKSSVPVGKLVIGVAGIEPATFPSQTERATAALHTEMIVSIFITPDYGNYQTASDDLGVFLGYVPNDYQRKVGESNSQGL